MDMKFYRTKESNIINLGDEDGVGVEMIFKDPVTGYYRVAYKSGHTYEVPELDEEDIDRLMEYNNYFIDDKK